MAVNLAADPAAEAVRTARDMRTKCCTFMMATEVEQTFLTFPLALQSNYLFEVGQEVGWDLRISTELCSYVRMREGEHAQDLAGTSMNCYWKDGP